VWVYSNLEKVELLVNRKSLGTKDVPRDGQRRLDARGSELKTEIRQRGWFGKAHRNRVQSDSVEAKNISAQSVSVANDISQGLTAQPGGPNVTRGRSEARSYVNVASCQ